MSRDPRFGELDALIASGKGDKSKHGRRIMEYAQELARAKAIGITRGRFFGRLDIGWTAEEASTLPLGTDRRERSKCPSTKSAT